METVIDKPPAKIDEDTKKLLMDLIKGVNVEELTVDSEEHRKWYRFGAYDFGRMLAEKLKELQYNRIMANGNHTPPASQVENQSLAGHPPVQARPSTGQPQLATNSIVGQLPIPYFDQNKGKGNN